MNRAKFAQQREKIGKEIEGKNLIKKCCDLALSGELILHNERSDSSHVRWKYEDDLFLVYYESGHFGMGDGDEIKVSYGGVVVFLAYDDSLKRQKYPEEISIEANNLHVGTYISGPWEEKINSFLEEVQESKANEFQEKFRTNR